MFLSSFGGFLLLFIHRFPGEAKKTYFEKVFKKSIESFLSGLQRGEF